MDRVQAILDHANSVLGGCQTPIIANRGGIVVCDNPALDGTRCALTAGLSSEGSSDSPPDELGYELVTIIRNSSSSERAIPTLKGLIDDPSDLGANLERGKMVCLTPPLSPALTRALIVHGSPLPRELGHLPGRAGFLVYWVLPITEDEAAYGRRHGPSRLLLRLRWSGIDLFDLDREGIGLPAGITLDEYRRRAQLQADDTDLLLDLIDGEQERGRVVDVATLYLGSECEDSIQLGIEAVSVLARSEPESFSAAQISSIEDRLGSLLETQVASRETEEAIAAVRHAMIHSRG